MGINEEQLKKIAKDVRKEILTVSHNCGGGHVGSSYSSVEILTYLYFYKMNLKKKRDRLILSKGHAGLAAAVIYNKLGIISKEDLYNFNKLNSKVSIHLDENKIELVDLSTGSLGHGESVAFGWALANKIQGKNEKIYCLLGDGELNEGSCWEAFLAINKYQTTNLITIIDQNDMTLDGFTDEVMPLNSLQQKLTAFNFNVFTCNGHDFNEIDCAINCAISSEKPSAIVLKTIKGKGVSFIENQAKWHYSFPTDDELYIAIKEIDNE